MNLGGYDAMWNVHLERIREDAHQLLAWAYVDIRDRLDADTTEPVMTGLLADAMRTRLNHHEETPATYDLYSIHPEDSISPHGELGSERLRLDITVQLNGVRPRGVFIFEAKRLRTGGFPIGLYTGPEGLRCFVEGRYAEECREAAMVALWQNRDLAYWLRELQRSLEEDQRMAQPLLGVASDLIRTEVVRDLPNEWTTTHQREFGDLFRVFHIFLDCR